MHVYPTLEPLLLQELEPCHVPYTTLRTHTRKQKEAPCLLPSDSEPCVLIATSGPMGLQGQLVSPSVPQGRPGSHLLRHQELELSLLWHGQPRVWPLTMVPEISVWCVPLSRTGTKSWWQVPLRAKLIPLTCHWPRLHRPAPTFLQKWGSPPLFPTPPWLELTPFTCHLSHWVSYTL